MMFLWLYFFAVTGFTASAVTLPEILENLESQLEKWALKNQTKEESDRFLQAMNSISLKEHGTELLHMPLSALERAQQTTTCTLCKAALQVIITLHRAGILSLQAIYAASLPICLVFTGYQEIDCAGILSLYLPIILYIVDNAPEANAGSFCGLIFESNDPSECPLDDPRFEWTVDIPTKPATAGYVPPATTPQKLLKIAHLTDAHIDPLYHVGSPAHCIAPVCCRDEYTATNTTTKAGYWGDYGNCDTPVYAFTNILDEVVGNNDDIDIVYFTGDIVDHSIGQTSYESITNSIKIFSSNFRDYFKGIPVVPVIGNHEAQPMGQFAPKIITEEDYTTSWLYTLLLQEWSQWIPNDQVETFMIAGYYTVLLKPGFRAIVLNSNVAYRYNWWIVYNPVDPKGQLKWLVDTLSKAERACERVHILSHIPPGYTETYTTWNREYKRVMDRFADTIASEFDGHMHTDEIKLYYDNEDQAKPTIVAWNGGGMVTFTTYNVNYKIMEVNPDTLYPVDIYTYIYNLTEANQTPDEKPKWFMSYSFREAYDLPTLEPTAIDGMINKMATTRKDLLQKYIFYFGKEGDEYLRDVEESYDSLGQEYYFDYICKMVTTNLLDTRKCDEFKAKYFAEANCS